MKKIGIALLIIGLVQASSNIGNVLHGYDIFASLSYVIGSILPGSLLIIWGSYRKKNQNKKV